MHESFIWYNYCDWFLERPRCSSGGPSIGFSAPASLPLSAGTSLLLMLLPLMLLLVLLLLIPSPPLKSGLPEDTEGTGGMLSTFQPVPSALVPYAVHAARATRAADGKGNPASVMLRPDLLSKSSSFPPP